MCELLKAYKYMFLESWYLTLKVDQFLEKHVKCVKMYVEGVKMYVECVKLYVECVKMFVEGVKF